MSSKIRQMKKDSGFTIIEVLIVLAIAGLIMVVVFLAVPALQRSGRNNALNVDANNILTAVGNYSSNNNGNLPTTPSSATAPTGNVVTLSATTGSPNSETATVDTSVKTVQVINTATGVIDNTSPVGTVQIVTGTYAKCNANASGLFSTSTATANLRSYVVLFVAESGSGNILKCIGG